MAVKIALAGNPNCGKTTLFNALTGSNQFVGNWPGVTVEKMEGRLKGHKDVTIMDLPGIYSLSPDTHWRKWLQEIILLQTDRMQSSILWTVQILSVTYIFLHRSWNLVSR